MKLEKSKFERIIGDLLAADDFVPNKESVLLNVFADFAKSQLREFGGRIKEFAAKGHLQDGDVVATLNTQIDKELEELE